MGNRYSSQATQPGDDQLITNYQQDEKLKQLEKDPASHQVSIEDELHQLEQSLDNNNKDDHKASGAADSQLNSSNTSSSQSPLSHHQQQQLHDPRMQYLLHLDNDWIPESYANEKQKGSEIVRHLGVLVKEES